MSEIHISGRGGFIERTIEDLRRALGRSLDADQAAFGSGLLQRFDPRVKVVGLGALILASAFATKLVAIVAILVLATLLGLLSSVSLRTFATRVWSATLVFSGILAAPALFLTAGAPIYHVPLLDWTITAQGRTTAEFLVLRAECAATLALVLVFTTPWMHVLKALRLCRVPVVFVVILGMACRYILLLLESAHEMFESRQSRTVGPLSRAEQRRVAVLSTGALFTRTVQLSNEVYLAMQARGFRGEVYLLDDFEMQSTDWLALATFGGVAAGLAWAGR